ncbi:transmembrane exosortase [bacterium BMS3Bbin14]|nr:transmembrane exosortase [bacterium BMS3Bbin14]HDL98078.1 exosortase/archaeosortase family protein [Desulfobacteraceae bacterium]HDO31283.1 exosortase/archaeosortase family protein [Desulfobacteraceae bacterium]
MTSNKLVNVLGVGALALIIAFCYSAVFQWMYGRYMNADSYYSHGFLVPFVTLFLIWLKRDQLLNQTQQGSRAGLVLIVAALLLHILGTLLYIFAVSSFSLFFLIIGLTLYLCGNEITRTIRFPLLFLIFMFPLPEAILGIVSFPLKIFAAKAGVWLVGLLGIPIHGEGFNIFIPAGELLVGNPCSGLRSLIAFLALGAVFAYLSNLTLVRKYILFFIAIPIAILSNIIRVPILILVSYYWGLKAAAPDTLVHTASGLLVFVLGFFLLMMSAKVLEWRA